MDTNIQNRYCVYGYRDPDNDDMYYYIGQGTSTRPYDKHEPNTVSVDRKERFSPSVQRMIESGNIVPDRCYIDIIQKNMGKCEAQLLEQTLIKEHGINTSVFDQTDKGHTLLNSSPGEYPVDIYTNLIQCPDRRELYNTLYEQKKTPNLDRYLYSDEIWKMSPREYAKHKSNKQYRDEALKYQTWAKQSLNSDNTEYVKQVAILVDKGISLTDAIDQLKNKDNKKKRNKTKKKSNTNKKTLVELQKEHADLKKQMKRHPDHRSMKRRRSAGEYKELQRKLGSLARRIQLAKKSRNNIFKKPKKKKNRKKKTTKVES